MTACSQEVPLVLELNPIDSLEYDMVNAIDLAVHNDMLFVADEFKGIWYYSVNDISNKGMIGSEGRGPGEFFQVISIEGGDDSLLYVSDIGNNRISIFTDKGEYVDAVRDIMTTELTQSDSLLYCREFTGKFDPDNTLFSIKHNNINAVSTFKSYITDNDEYKSFCVEDQLVYILKEIDGRYCLAIFSKSVEIEANYIKNMKLDYDDGSTAKILGVTNEGIWLIAISYEYGDEKKIRDFRTRIEKAQSSIVLINRQGIVLKQYNLADHHRIIDSSVNLYNNLVFFIDIKQERIYKYDLTF